MVSNVFSRSSTQLNIKGTQRIKIFYWRCQFSSEPRRQQRAAQKRLEIQWGYARFLWLFRDAYLCSTFIGSNHVLLNAESSSTKISHQVHLWTKWSTHLFPPTNMKDQLSINLYKISSKSVFPVMDRGIAFHGSFHPLLWANWFFAYPTKSKLSSAIGHTNVSTYHCFSKECDLRHLVNHPGPTSETANETRMRANS